MKTTLDFSLTRWINPGALARCKEALWLGELFQQLIACPDKPLKRLRRRRDELHRAKAAVLIKGCGNWCEVSGVNGLPILPLIILGFLATCARGQQAFDQQPVSSAVDSDTRVIAETPYAIAS